ncbi:general transcriptional corepressor trfA isoform X2 [Venturia canescens]|uniref:general transcriptional corepressor trfA isoform X2 n=1 Tax=Venturia canescens TaxID=32260 RepID=UPI001C9CDDDB|nr:general transcriptional corepressor trfA isoform X2 [Venturia canescens]
MTVFRIARFGFLENVRVRSLSRSIIGGEGCVEKPVSTLWRNYVGSSRPDVMMRLTVTNGGLTATTKDHGLTEYWAHRVTYCAAPASHPRLFVWVYRHEGRRLRPELRCHAALCSKESTARRLASTLNARLQQALLEFRRDKVSRQNARLSLANAVYENPSLPRRKILLSTGGQNYRPPLERSKSAPKLSAIEEDAVAEEIEQKRLLEELRSLENVARSWQDQDGWRLARLVDALNRAGASSEYSDENGSISSGCETASTSNSEERVPGTNDHHNNNNNNNNSNGSQNTSNETNEPRTGRRVIFADDVLRSVTSTGPGPRRNSDGSPNFMTCAGSPRFHCSRVKGRNRYGKENSVDDDMMEEEIEEEDVEEANRHVFDFEDPEDFDEVVDYTPHGESPSRLENATGRRIDVKGEKYPSIMRQVDKQLIESEETTFLTLDSLDEEEADSDESGYVEAPPKSLLGQEEVGKESEETYDSIDNKTNVDNVPKIVEESSIITSKIVVANAPEDRKLERTIKEYNSIDEKSSNLPLDKCPHQDKTDDSMNNNQKIKDREKVDFIKCPISETIKKLANASLRSSKSLEISTTTCLKALNNLKTSKSFDSTRHVENEEESPSLHQRKQLLAQQGVKV